MTFFQFVHLGAMGLSFAYWAICMFVMLFRLSDRSLLANAAQGGGYFGWIAQWFRDLRGAASSKKDRSLRRKILWSGVCLVVLTALTPVVANLGR
ncbi:MAG: hypothetical protein AB8B82_10270 [Roseovarius sp.]